jgi:hypothetical protein
MNAKLYPKTLTKADQISVDYILEQVKKEYRSTGKISDENLSYWNLMFSKRTGREILTGDILGWPEDPVKDFVDALRKI